MTDTPIEDVVLAPRRISVRRLLIVSWVLVGAVASAVAAVEPGPWTIVVPMLLAAVFVMSEVSGRLSARARHRGLRDLMLRLDNTTYTHELQNLPNRNYMLDQLRREMPRARATGVPFVVVVVTIEDPAAIAGRRGEDFAERTSKSFARLIERCTRASDFAAELGRGSYAILLYDCGAKMAQSYLRRIPGGLSVSTGKAMLEIPLVVRVSEYDMESVYAIDVLREAEEAEPAREAERLRFGAEAA